MLRSLELFRMMGDRAGSQYLPVWGGERGRRYRATLRAASRLDLRGVVGQYTWRWA